MYGLLYSCLFHGEKSGGSIYHSWDSSPVLSYPGNLSFLTLISTSNTSPPPPTPTPISHLSAGVKRFDILESVDKLGQLGQLGRLGELGQLGQL
jgi:hypothetical protein